MMLSEKWVKKLEFKQFCNNSCIKYDSEENLFFTILDGDLLAVSNKFYRTKHLACEKQFSSFGVNNDPSQTYNTSHDDLIWNNHKKSIQTIITGDGGITCFDIRRRKVLYLVSAGDNNVLRSWKINFDNAIEIDRKDDDTMDKKFSKNKDDFNKDAYTNFNDRKISNSNGYIIPSDDSWISGSLIQTWKLGSKSHITCCSIDLTCNLVAVGTIDGNVLIFSIQKGHCTHQLEKSDSAVSTLRFPDDSLYLFCGFSEGEVKVFCPISNQCIMKFNDHSGKVSDISIQKLQNYDFLDCCVTCGYDKTINIYFFNGSPESKKNEVKQENISVLSKKKKKFKFKKENKSNPIKVSIDIGDFKQASQFFTTESITSILCLPFENVFKEKRESIKQSLKNVPEWVLLTVGSNGSINVWNPVDRMKIFEYEEIKRKNITIIRMIELQNNKISVVSSDFFFFFIKLPDFELIGGASGAGEDYLECKFLPDFHLQLLKANKFRAMNNGSNSNELRVRDSQESVDATDVSVRNMIDEFSHDNLEMLDDSSEIKVMDNSLMNNNLNLKTELRIMTLNSDEFIRIYSVNLNHIDCNLLIGHSDSVLCADISVNGCFIASGSKDETVRLWHCDLVNGRFCCIAKFSGHSSPVTAVNILKKKKRKAQSNMCECLIDEEITILSGDSGGILKLWRYKWKQGRSDDEISEVNLSEFTVVAHKKDINNISVSQNRKYIATSSQDKVINIWSLGSCWLNILGSCVGHTRGVWNTCFSSLEKVLLSASADTTLKMWNFIDFTCLKTFQGHEGVVFKAIFLDNCMQIMSCGADNLIKLWNIRTSDCINTLDGHDDKVWSIDIYSKYMVSGGSDGKMIIWKDTTSESRLEEISRKENDLIECGKIDLLVKNGKISEALSICLNLNRMKHLRTIIQEYSSNLLNNVLIKRLKTIERKISDPLVTEDDNQENTEINSLLSVGTNDFTQMDEKNPSNQSCNKNISEISDLDIQNWISSLNDFLLNRLIKMICIWNTNSRTSYFANFLLKIILLNIDHERLRKLPDFKSGIKSLIFHGSKHENRISNWVQKSYIIDTLSSTCPVELMIRKGFISEPTVSIKKSSELEASSNRQKSLADSIQQVKESRNTITYEYLFVDGNSTNNTS